MLSGKLRNPTKKMGNKSHWILSQSYYLYVAKQKNDGNHGQIYYFSGHPVLSQIIKLIKRDMMNDIAKTMGVY